VDKCATTIVRDRLNEISQKLLVAKDLVKVQIFVHRYVRDDEIMQVVLEPLTNLTNVRDEIEICVVPGSLQLAGSKGWQEHRYVFRPGPDVLALEEDHSAKQAWDASVQEYKATFA
jgi:hypothetical protein